MTSRSFIIKFVDVIPIQFSSCRNRIGKRMIYFPQIESTNRWLKEISAIPEDGTVVFTSNQTKGTGQRSRVWEHFPGNLAFSIFFHLEEGPEKIPYSLIFGILLQRFLRKNFSLSAEIKWPNDLLIEGEKISGILCESFYRDNRQYLICGIGFNLFKPPGVSPVEFPVTFLDQKTIPRILPFSILELILEEAEEIFDELRTEGLSGFISEWNRNSGMPGRTVYYKEKGISVEARVDSINDAGNLVVKEKYSGKTRTLFSGEVSLLKPWENIQNP